MKNNMPTHLPKVWKKGQLFDFSGMEGQTDWFKPATGITLGNKAGFCFHNGSLDGLAYLCNMHLAVSINGTIIDKTSEYGHNCVCSDLVDLVLVENEKLKIRVIFTYAAKGVVLSKVLLEEHAQDIGNIEIFVVLTVRQCKWLYEQDGYLIFDSVNDSVVITGNFDDYAACDSYDEFISRKWGEPSYKGKPAAKTVIGRLRLSKDIKLATCKSGQFTFLPVGLGSYCQPLNIDTVIKKKIRNLTSLQLPSINDSSLLQTYLKACSTLKANVESSQGFIKFRWTTPARHPFRYMWLWDAAFQAMGYKYISSKMGEDAVKATLSVQADDGYIPIISGPNLRCYHDDFDPDMLLTQPPTLAWAAWDVYKHTKNRSFLKYCEPKLIKHIKWILQNRDINQNGLLEWYVRSSDKICPCGESGMDNSARFLSGERIDAIDLNALAVNEIRHIELISEELNSPKDNQLLAAKDNLIRLINKHMWDDNDGFYYDLRPNGSLLSIKTIATFYTLLAKIPTTAQAARMIEHLVDKNEFWGELPVRSLAQNEPTYDRNMWRGPVWPNCNFIVIEGLKEYGYSELADKIALSTIQAISKWYHSEGSIFELYSDRDEPPHKLPRKDGHLEVSSPVIREYGWSCAVYIELLNRFSNIL